ncbi:MlaE family ABC transporter permease [Pelagibacterium xiamenense]|uniref:MlaE family ABC transporter permease n=1 Tax=Pelagibacterium xiamenense TaxID=2901140 RepID=UPI001E510B25|nr:ABC transporter permease [Pelagibacterium xiamenense]MCD7059408.1 ABC transporter permease [Pelagibacterium xiamenense]
MAATDEPVIDISSADGVLVASLSGSWTAQWARQMQNRIEAAFKDRPSPPAVRFDLHRVTGLDTVGAWLIARKRDLFSQDGTVEIAEATEAHAALLDRVNEVGPHVKTPRRGPPWYLAPLDGLGHMSANALGDIFRIHAVLGQTIGAAAATLSLKARFRFTAFINQFDLIVFRAVPIVVLISLVVGAIITQQSILQLNNFGVGIYVVDLAAILMLREVGLLLAAIMIAGRSGSAITAELGTMRMREELDALAIMGVDPYQALILPRMLALLIGMPVLSFVGSLAGLGGAAVVALTYGGIPFETFLDRLQDTLTFQSLFVGLIKAPVMAVIIGLVAANEGFKVRGSAESLGRHTTASVVRAIFLVIVADGLFAVFFAAIGF